MALFEYCWSEGSEGIVVEEGFGVTRPEGPAPGLFG